SSPAMILRSVDFPAPLAPTSTYRLPGSKRIETFSKRIFGPYRLESFSSVIIEGAGRSTCARTFPAKLSRGLPCPDPPDPRLRQRGRNEGGPPGPTPSPRGEP